MRAVFPPFPSPGMTEKVEGRTTFVLALLLSLFATPAAAIEIPMLGGEVWGFSKRIEAVGECGAVTFASPAGTVPAWREGGRWAAVVPLRDGANAVTAHCDDGSSARRTYTVPLADAPQAWIRINVNDDKVMLDGGRSRPAEGQAAPIARWEWSSALPLAGSSGERIELDAPAADGEYTVTLRVTDALGRSDEATTMFRVRAGRAEAINLSHEHPAWADEAVVYGVIPHLFGPRGLTDVTARLDHIQALGATVLWLAPITDSPDDDFGYAVRDHMRLRPGIGSEADLRRLVDQAHARGMRVIMDFVPNHVSDEHRWFRHAATHGPASPYHDLFERRADGTVETYFHWDNLKNLDFDHPEVRRHLTAAFARWVREFGIDGFRVDVAWGPKQRAPDFWPQWRAALKRIDPDLFLVAEASARDPYYVANGFDAAYDWTEELGRWAWQAAFGGEHIDAAALRTALRHAYAPDTLILRFLNNNDTGARFVTRHGPAATRAAATLMFTLPGLPLIYTGDELAAEYEPYDEGPPLDWDGPAPLAEHYRRLAELRRAEPALRAAPLELVATDADTVVAYRRGPLLVLVNFGAAAVTPSGPDLGDGPWSDLLTGETLATPALPPYGARVLRLSPARPAATRSGGRGGACCG